MWVTLNLCLEVNSNSAVVCDIWGPLTSPECMFYVYICRLCVVVFHAN